jgi:H+-transporting ATPase
LCESGRFRPGKRAIAASDCQTGSFARLDIDAPRTLAPVTLVFSGQAVLYVVRERAHLWRSRPGTWLMATSVVDVLIIASLTCSGTVMTALPLALVSGVLVAAALFALALDTVKVVLLRRLRIV